MSTNLKPYRSQTETTAEVLQVDEEFAVLRFESGTEWAASLDELPTDLETGDTLKIHVWKEV